MASLNKKKKQKNSYCMNSSKNSFLKCKLKKLYFYTASDRKINKKIDING